jgi:hypothetical protein
LKENVLTGEGVRGWVGVKSRDGEKAWSSINPSILSGFKLYYSIQLIYSISQLPRRQNFLPQIPNRTRTG